MLTKSKIQLIKENLEYKNNIKIAIENLLEKFQINDNIFIWNNEKNQLVEVVKGYFVIEKESDNLNDVMADNCKAIRVINNKFQSGNVYLNTKFLPENKNIINI